MPTVAPAAPGRDCALCPRLVEYRRANRAAHPDWHNAPVPSFGPLDARLLILGLAPGRMGANRTGRPFTGDAAGQWLYRMIEECGLSRGKFDARADDGLELVDCRIANAVRCLPPANKPLPEEVKACRSYLRAELAAMNCLRVVLALGQIAHNALLGALDLRPNGYRFGHGARFELPDGRWLVDSYHCSRQNTNTGRLTEPMFRAVFEDAKALLGKP